ncbi:glycine dehydrogenase (aminomethyl-transferring) [bacterium J17]|nr:glycine dehydrogenase (aminomethyl-transferring) [bacterium J17]
MNAELSKLESSGRSLSVTDSFGEFVRRHVGLSDSDIAEMLDLLGADSLDEFIDTVVPENIRRLNPMKFMPALSETEVIKRLKKIAAQNKIARNFIGNGFYDCIVPPVIQRNILENPAWYTQYTPYQPEIAQGRLEALFNFQTMICDLSGMEIANASLLDEGTAAAEAMTLCQRVKSKLKREKFFVAEDCHPHVIDVVKTRAEPLGIEVVVASPEASNIDSSYFAALLQYPGTDGRILDYEEFTGAVHEQDALVIASVDLLSLALIKPPGEWGADVVVGNSQRFGVPLGFGGPHAAFIATKDGYRRDIPGRIVGLSKDSEGRDAYRLALQTREQHIRREKATSNICTAQVLLAVMAGMYAVYHGPKGIRRIAKTINKLSTVLAERLVEAGLKLKQKEFFDTLVVVFNSSEQAKVKARAEAANINLRYFNDGSVACSLDETSTVEDLADLLAVFLGGSSSDYLTPLSPQIESAKLSIPAGLRRISGFMTNEVFSKYHSETEMVRYIHKLASRDLSLIDSMIPLGSCTMKLNATTEMLPVTWPEFSSLHPFAPGSQTAGYEILFKELEDILCECTGFAAASLQPNAGSQGEYAGLLAIQAYHAKNGNPRRTACLIPQSAHGTNPASAILAGLKVVPVKCDDQGNIDVADLKEKSEKYKDELSSLMITYPSTHGVFEESVKDICSIVHEYGGQVYMDGANLNAQVGLCSPAELGADVCHINLHKTFCIPHGGGGPGVGPIAVAEHLAEFLPGHFAREVGGKSAIGAVCSAPWGSASIVVISWAYAKMMGSEGLEFATKTAILSANYMAEKLQSSFPVLYRGANGRIAHECILDLRNFKRNIGIEVADVAKRLMDYGFHAPTVSFPVVETLMIEPTESESKAELDRFCQALQNIREEIAQVEKGEVPKDNNVLKNSPHTVEAIASDDWARPYSRETAVFPAQWLRDRKFWPSVSRIDNVYGDRNLICSCPSMDQFLE